ncbi:hypothetical protein TrVE_jg14323 [Triparma verrucosa]|uniref:Tyrosine specific protein phosphatases domain-containing protein n=1 Tax=Triparma verrucosa TaxID=1606542 RepID=A0A9W7EUP6_9STRA|nr:hypothetical protein TrVE_jg14323 [Triparma verrucosa]
MTTFTSMIPEGAPGVSGDCVAPEIASILSVDRTDRWCAQQIAPGIWVGSVKAAPYSPSNGKPNEIKARYLQSQNIRYIINCGVHPTKSSATAMIPPPGFHYLYLNGLQENSPNLSTYLTECVNFFATAHASNSAILVHCAMGIYRSPAVAAALLIAQSNGELTVGDQRTGAMSIIQKARSRATSNPTLIRQLEMWRYNMWPPQQPHKRTKR